MISNPRGAVAVALVVALAVVAATTVGPLGSDGGGQQPADSAASIADVDTRVAETNGSAATVRSDVRLTGRHSDPLVLDYRLAANDVQMASGERRVRLQGDETVPMTARVPHDRATRWWTSHMRNDQRTERVVTVTARSPEGEEVATATRRRTVETDVLGGFNSTVSRPLGENVTGGGPFLTVERTAAWVESVDRQGTDIQVRIDVHNPHAYPVSYYGFGYRLTMNGVVVGESDGETRGVIQPRSTRTVRLTLSLDHQRLDEWWRTHLDRGERTEFRMAFSTRAEGSAGVVELPLDSLTYTHEFDTSIVGNETVSTATASARAERRPHRPGRR